MEFQTSAKYTLVTPGQPPYMFHKTIWTDKNMNIWSDNSEEIFALHIHTIRLMQEKQNIKTNKNKKSGYGWVLIFILSSLGRRKLHNSPNEKNTSSPESTEFSWHYLLRETYHLNFIWGRVNHMCPTTNAETAFMSQKLRLTFLKLKARATSLGLYEELAKWSLSFT